MNKQVCTKEQYPDFDEDYRASGKSMEDLSATGESLIIREFDHGGRTHYVVACPIHGSHEWVGQEWGVSPKQPALGWS